MEPTKEPVRFVAHNLLIWEVDRDSFSVAGRRFFAKDHGFKVGDTVRITIEKDSYAHPDHNNQT